MFSFNLTYDIEHTSLYVETHTTAYEGPFSELQCETMYYKVDKNRTNDSISIEHIKAVYLEGNPTHIDVPSVQSNVTSLTLMIPHPIAITHDDTLTVSGNGLETTHSGGRVRFPEHLVYVSLKNVFQK